MKLDQDGRLPIQLGTLSVLGGILVYCARSFEGQVAASVAFWIVFGLGFLTAIIAAAFVVKGHVGHAYERVPLPSALSAHRRALEAYYLRQPGSSGSADQDFAEFLLARLVHATDRNVRANIRRSGTFHTALCWMVWSFAFALIAGLITLPSMRSDANRSQARTEINMSDVQKPNESEKPTSQPAAQPTASKPVGPENIIFKGGRIISGDSTSSVPPKGSEERK